MAVNGKGELIGQRTSDGGVAYGMEPGANAQRILEVDQNGNPTNGISDFQTASVTVTSTATELKTSLTEKRQVVIYPPDAGVIYWGTASVTTTTGAPLAAGDPPIEITFANGALKVYAVSDGTDRAVRVVESK